MFKQIPLSVRDDIAVDYEAGRPIADWAAKYDMDEKTLKERIAVVICRRRKKEQAEQTPMAVLTNPKPPLTNIAFIKPETDQKVWLEKLKALATNERYITVMHLCDIHSPFQDEAALEVAYQLVGYVQPHIIGVGSDAGDFTELATFQPDPDDSSDGDVLDEFESFWTDHIDTLDRLVPNAIFVWMLGNHEKRVYDYVVRQAPAVRNTVWKRFVQIIRHGGRVLWLGETDTVRIGPLLLTHGNRAGSNPAQALYSDAGGQVSVMAGHVHRLSYYGKRGEDYMVEAITSGCLAKPPHYLKRERSAKWQTGTAIAEVDLQGREVTFHNLKFETSQDSMWVRFERHLFETPYTPPYGQEAVIW